MTTLTSVVSELSIYYITFISDLDTFFDLQKQISLIFQSMTIFSVQFAVKNQLSLYTCIMYQFHDCKSPVGYYTEALKNSFRIFCDKLFIN